MRGSRYFFEAVGIILKLIRGDFGVFLRAI